LGSRQSSATTIMPFIEKPHFTVKVEQTKSAFAEGNARW
jgi:NCS1 family nucleobase:cation symporter-1